MGSLERGARGRVRVLLVAPLPPPCGGISNGTLAALRMEAVRRDVLVRVVDTSPRWRAVDNLSFASRVVGGCLQGARDLLRLLAMLVWWRPEVMVLPTSGSLATIRDLACLRLARWFGVPILYELHFGRLPELARLGTWDWRLLRWAASLATRVVALDGQTLAALRDAGFEAKAVFMPNGVEVNLYEHRYGALTGGRRSVVFVGWVIPTKGIAELIDAWCGLAAPEWVLRIVGPVDRAYQRALLSRAGDRGESISFTGELGHDAAMRVLSRADIVVLPSHTEGFPNVILEAMACARPIVASRVGAIPEMLADGSGEECGVLVEPGDARELLWALQHLIDDPTRRAKLGARARARVVVEYDDRVVMNERVALWVSLARRSERDAVPGRRGRGCAGMQ